MHSILWAFQDIYIPLFNYLTNRNFNIRILYIYYSPRGEIVAEFCHQLKTQVWTYGLANAEKVKLLEYSCKIICEICLKVMCGRHRKKQSITIEAILKYNTKEKTGADYCVYVKQRSELGGNSLKNHMATLKSWFLFHSWR